MIFEVSPTFLTPVGILNNNPSNSTSGVAMASRNTLSLQQYQQTKVYIEERSNLINSSNNKATAKNEMPIQKKDRKSNNIQYKSKNTETMPAEIQFSNSKEPAGKVLPVDDDMTSADFDALFEEEIDENEDEEDVEHHWNYLMVVNSCIQGLNSTGQITIPKKARKLTEKTKLENTLRSDCADVNIDVELKFLERMKEANKKIKKDAEKFDLKPERVLELNQMKEDRERKKEEESRQNSGLEKKKELFQNWKGEVKKANSKTDLENKKLEESTNPETNSYGAKIADVRETNLKLLQDSIEAKRLQQERLQKRYEELEQRLRESEQKRKEETLKNETLHQIFIVNNNLQQQQVLAMQKRFDENNKPQQALEAICIAQQMELLEMQRQRDALERVVSQQEEEKRRMIEEDKMKMAQEKKRLEGIRIQQLIRDFTQIPPSPQQIPTTQNHQQQPHLGVCAYGSCNDVAT